AKIYFWQDEYNKAIKTLEESIALDRKIGNIDGVRVNLYNLGRSYYKVNNYKMAAKSFSESVDLLEKIRKTAKGVVRRDFLAQQISMYQMLSSSYIRLKDYSNAAKAIERSRAKFLAEQIEGPQNEIFMSSFKGVQNDIPEDEAVVMFGNINRKNKIVMAIDKDNIFGVEFANQDLYDSEWKINNKNATSLLANQRALKIVEREKNQKTSAEIKPGCNCDEMINYYRTLIIDAADKGKAVNKDRVVDISRKLYDIFIKPIEKQISGKKKLVIVTDGALGFLPFETLIDGRGKYMAEKYDISYVQSMGVMELLKKREYGENRKPLLAFGGALYDRPTPLNKGKKLAKLDSNRLSGNNSTRRAYNSMGVGDWDYLPNTLKEVNAISKLYERADIYTGKNASEDVVKKLSLSGELSKYRVIHFATHGFVNPAIPELSAVVMSQVKGNKVEDGYLSMGEISKLKLKADFVNLSACETGLG
ncbi:CHAT domain-containing protein, partial [bacterium]|nr:CHAT domain-containing protein [bacterium]